MIGGLEGDWTLLEGLEGDRMLLLLLETGSTGWIQVGMRSEGEDNQSAGCGVGCDRMVKSSIFRLDAGWDVIPVVCDRRAITI